MKNIAFVEDEDMIVASCKDSGVTSQGHTKEEALRNLYEAVTLYKEEFS
ncbi:MAG: hypothetical protein OXR66_02075 [Candidatus Woesearchaeota archaeon]|nr:hypothetical protein [Candidatus Woesearchaeota archaeon]